MNQATVTNPGPSVAGVPKKIWVTGASMGIGAAVARLLLEQGCELVISARGNSALQTLVDEFPERCFPLVLDVADSTTNAAAADFLRSKLGYLDSVIVNAGTCEYSDVQNFSAAMIERVMAVNVMGAANTIEVALPLLRAAPNPGQIVGVSSMATVLPMPRSEAYGASKAALEYLLSSLRVDLAAEHVAVSIVRPGFVKTPLTERNDFPMPFLQTPEQAAHAIVSGMWKRKLLIRFPWPLVTIMGFVSLLPESWQIGLLKKMSRNSGASHGNA